mmetsp:Transcript_12640/g.23317  ORF Transcript_12640/g.23317 Transcript_12640/m.23317 type:complete len:100 (-) Transcript_12640:27-326(-)
MELEHLHSVGFFYFGVGGCGGEGEDGVWVHVGITVYVKEGWHGLGFVVELDDGVDRPQWVWYCPNVMMRCVNENGTQFVFRSALCVVSKGMKKETVVEL